MLIWFGELFVLMSYPSNPEQQAYLVNFISMQLIKYVCCHTRQTGQQAYSIKFIFTICC